MDDQAITIVSSGSGLGPPIARKFTIHNIRTVFIGWAATLLAFNII
ncbi:MAG: hypothetical protein KF763_00035 [Cyclobacteriaceae bacterium]|nr:hypothetical protein [Cyclobacteriaceae bacterium]